MILSTLLAFFIAIIIMLIILGILSKTKDGIIGGIATTVEFITTLLFPIYCIFKGTCDIPTFFKWGFQILLVGIFISIIYLYYIWIKLNFQNPDLSGNIASELKNFKTQTNSVNNFFNTIMLTGIGALALGLFTQFNNFDTPIQPLKWPWPGYNPNSPISSCLVIILKGIIGASLFSFLGYQYGGTEKTTVGPIAGLLGFLIGLMLNFKGSTRTLSYKATSYISSLFKIFIVVVVILGLIWLIQKHSILSKSLSIIFLLASIGVILFTVFNFLYSNPSFRKFIRKNTIFRILFYVIFLIPCFVSFLFEGVVAEYGRTQQYVLMILLVEAIILALYFVIPLFIRWFYLRRPIGSLAGRKSNINKRKETANAAFYNKQYKINSMRSVIPGITWDEIWLPMIGTPVSVDHRNVMRNKLAALGYTDSGTKTCPPQIDNTYYDRFKSSLGLIPQCSISSAIDYIIKMRPIILEEEVNLQQLKQTYKHLQYESNELNNIFDTKQLINTPVSTDKILTNKDWYYTNLKEGDSHNYIYSLSCWIYINQSASNTNFRNNSYASLINYGDKPTISYNHSKKILRISVQTGINAHKYIYKTNKFPLQKWNNIMINFDGGTLDVFINNKLVTTEKNVIPYISSDKISIGEKDGVSGGICNVVYYPDTLGQTKMSLFYNTLKLKNPPIL